MFNKISKIKTINLALAIIIVFSIFIRLWNLENNPYGLFCDEASIGYNAYSVLTTGKDEHGVTFPVLFKAFGEYKNPVFVYSAVPIIWVFGLSEFSVRLTSVMYGVGSVILLYLLTRKLFNKDVALISALLLALSPWHIHYSRIAFELISSIFWLLMYIFLQVKSFENKRFFPFALMSLIIAFFTYTTIKIYLPIFLLLFIIIYYKEFWDLAKSRTFWVSSATLGLLFILLILPSIKDGTFFARWDEVRDESLSLSKVFTAYLNHFTPTFLFSKGDIDYPGQFITRHSIRGVGQLYWIQLPMVIASIIIPFIFKKYKKGFFLALALLAIYPLGSVFASINPQASRSIIGVLPFQILSALGIYQVLYLLKKYKWGLVVYGSLNYLILMVSFFHFTGLISNYPKYSSDYWGWQYGPKEIISYFKSNQSQYDEMYMTGFFNQPYIFLKFYDPEKECENCFIGSIDRRDESLRQLFALRAEEFNTAVRDTSDIKHIVRLPDGKEEFYIIELQDT